MKTKIFKCEKCATQVNDSQSYCHDCGSRFDASEDIDDDKVVAFVISKKPKNRTEALVLISEYLRKNRVRYSSFEDYNEATEYILSKVGAKVPDARYNTYSKKVFKETYNKEPSVGLTWTVRVDSPGSGVIKYKVTKIVGDLVYLDVDVSGVRELTASDVE